MKSALTGRFPGLAAHSRRARTWPPKPVVPGSREGGRVGRGGDRLLRRRRSRTRSGTRALQAVRPGVKRVNPGLPGLHLQGVPRSGAGGSCFQFPVLPTVWGSTLPLFPLFFPFPLMRRSRLGFINPETRAANKREKRMVKAIYGRKKGLIFCSLSPWR